MKVFYQAWKPGEAATAMIARANRIIGEYAAQGFDVTLRQLFYQFVSRDEFPADRTWKWTGSRWVRDPNGTKNATPNYKWLGDLISRGRRAGLVDWSAIVDLTRNLKSNPHWDSASEFIEPEQYATDKWASQPYRVEIWIEKDALVGVFQGICQQLDVPYFSCRGYNSDSEAWVAAQRLSGFEMAGQTPIILHFGDHDPSGIHMTQDIRNRIALLGGPEFEVRRLALNIEQVRKYQPPPNPAKEADPRFKAYMAEFGEESWELDALEPRVLAELVSTAVLGLRDEKVWDKRIREERRVQRQLKKVAARWSDVTKFLGGRDGK